MPKTRHPWRSARRFGLAAALAGSLAAAWWAIDYRHPANTQSAINQVVTVSAPLPNLAHGKSLTTVAFSQVIGVTASHPIESAFAVFTKNQEILRIDADGTEHHLAHTQAPVTWLSFSPSGRYLAACDMARNLYLVPWDGRAPKQYAIADYGTPLTVTVDDAGTMTWMDEQSKLFSTDPRTQSTTRLLGYEQAVPDSRDGSVVGTVQQNANRRELQISVNDLPLALRIQLRPDQLINDVDAAENQQTLAVMLSDSLLLVFRAAGEGRYRVQEHQFPAANGSAYARVSRDGRTALVATDKLYRIDLQQMRITAALPLPPDAGPIHDLEWRDNFGEIKISTSKQGLIWR